jgi:hypothetical protein
MLQRRAGHFRYEKIFFSLPGIEPGLLAVPAPSIVQSHAPFKLRRLIFNCREVAELTTDILLIDAVVYRTEK